MANYVNKLFRPGQVTKGRNVCYRTQYWEPWPVTTISKSFVTSLYRSFTLSPYFGSRYSDATLRRLLRFSMKVENRGLDHFRPKADKSTWQWHKCHQHYHSMETFSSYDLIRKYNSKVSNGQVNRNKESAIDGVTIESN